jgi:RND family efflux transporter MFP subunit
MKSIKKVVGWLFSHKLIDFLIIIALLTGFWFFTSYYAGNEEIIGFSTEVVKKGELALSLSGNGQVSASNQIDLKFKSSGDIIYLGVVAGQDIKKGALIAKLDVDDAKKNIRDAEVNLESVQVSLEKILKPADELDILQSENSLIQAKETKSDAEDDLEATYEEAFNDVSNSFLDLPNVMVGLQDILFSDDLSSGGQWNVSYYGDAIREYNTLSKGMSDLVYDTYIITKGFYDDNFSSYKDTKRYSEKEQIENLVSQTYETTRNISDVIKNLSNLIQLYKDNCSDKDLTFKPLSNTHLNSLNSYTGTINGILFNLLNIKNTIKNKQAEIISAERSIVEKEGSLAELKAGADEYDIRSAQISVSQKENELLDVRASLSDYYVYASFDGTIASVNVNKGETVLSGTVVATLVTKQLVAEVFLNEIEIADMKLGQKVNLEFDAAEDLIIEGVVSGIDTIGTVSSGVVNYGVEISFETDDSRIKIGMSVNAEIIVEEKLDTIVISNAAISEVKNRTFVQILEEGLSKRVPVVLGLVTDLKTEVLEGLYEGDEVIIGQSINSNSVTEKNISKESVSKDRNPNMDMMRMMKN